MPISKTKLNELAKSVEEGALSNGVSDSAVNELNRIVNKALAMIFPKGSSVELSSVKNRLSNLPIKSDGDLRAMISRATKCLGPTRTIPSATIKRMIRDQAGPFKVPDDTTNEVCGVLYELLVFIMSNSVRAIKDSVARLDAKHIKSSMSDRSNPNSELASVLMNVRARRLSSSKSRSSRSRSVSRRSRSGKKRSSSRKPCGRGKSPVRSFKRDGMTVKAYCRKSSPRRR
jgi:histone H3/H4